MASSTNQRVKDTVADVLRVPPYRVTDEASLTRDLSADSLDVIELGLHIEEDFGIEISKQDMAGFNCVGDITSYLSARGVE
jgi:acyl carrier protein